MGEKEKKYFTNAINNDIVFVAEKEGKIVGYLVGSICEPSSYIKVLFAELDNMFILENYRKYGIGSGLSILFRTILT